MFKAWSGGNTSWNIFTKRRAKLSCIFKNISKRSEKLCEIIYTIKLIRIVIILPINVEKKNTIERSISSFKKVNNRAHTIRCVISISLKNNIKRNRIDWKNIIKAIAPEKPKNFPRMKSCRLIGLLKIRKIVFPSTSLKRSWLPTNNIPISPKISIIPNPKSTITFSLSPIVRLPRAKENNIKINAKKRMRYKNLFLTISLKVFIAMFNMVWLFEGV